MCLGGENNCRALCARLNDLRLQSDLIDLDIVCEDRKISVHKIIVAAGSKFIKEQLNDAQAGMVQTRLCLETCGLQLKSDAVAAIIEFIYKGEVCIPGESLTDVCLAAHALKVIGLEHLPVPAEAPPYGPALPIAQLLVSGKLELGEESASRIHCNQRQTSAGQTATATGDILQTAAAAGDIPHELTNDYDMWGTSGIGLAEVVAPRVRRLPVEPPEHLAVASGFAPEMPGEKSLEVTGTSLAEVAPGVWRVPLEHLVVASGLTPKMPGGKPLRAAGKSGVRSPVPHGEFGVIGEKGRVVGNGSVPSSPSSPPATHLNSTTEQTIPNLKVFQCSKPTCGKFFKNRKTLRQHGVVHTPKAWACDRCDLKFSQKSHYDAHLKVHSEDSCFSCPWANCLKSYKHKHTLTVHVQKCHSLPSHK